MIGCNGYTDVIECSQYISDVYMQKSFFLIILTIFAFIMIYYSRTSHYKKVIKEFQSIKIMLFLPKILAYTFLGFSFYFPFLMSVNVSIEYFMRFIYGFVIPIVAWMSLFMFLLFTDWVIQRLGFENFKHFVNSAMKK